MVAAPRCAEKGIRFRVLNLGSPCETLLDAEVRSFSGRQLGLVLAILAVPTSVGADANDLRLHRPGARAGAPSVRVPVPIPPLHARLGDVAEAQPRPDASPSWWSIRLAISAFTREQAREFSPHLPETSVLHLALEERAAAGDVDGELLDRVGDGFLLIVGRMSQLERYKGHDELLAAMPRVAAACPSAKLVIAGDGDDRERLARNAAALGLAKRVVFTGFVSEATLGELYRRCAALVMPSRNEGFGLVYLEAMRAAKPCLALRRSAAEEIIVDGTTGVLVEPGDETQLVAALVRLLGDEAMGRRMGDAGRRRFEAMFTFKAFRDGLLPHLDRLLGIEVGDVRD